MSVFDLKTDPITLLFGDCLERMKEVPDGSVDMILTDPPYGTTACKWDSIIPLYLMWAQLKRIIKPNGAIVMTASQPFTTTLISSNMNDFKYCWVWDKDKAGNFATAKYNPLRVTEDICIFSNGKNTYKPIMVKSEKHNIRPRDNESLQKKGDTTHGISSKVFKVCDTHNEKLRYPKNIIRIKSTEKECNNINRVHPTQKPVTLMEYMIKTYTNENETVFDFTMGSGTTGVACKNTNRKFIGIELDPKYYGIACERILTA